MWKICDEPFHLATRHTPTSEIYIRNPLKITSYVEFRFDRYLFLVALMVLSAHSTAEPQLLIVASHYSRFVWVASQRYGQPIAFRRALYLGDSLSFHIIIRIRIRTRAHSHSFLCPPIPFVPIAHPHKSSIPVI